MLLPQELRNYTFGRVLRGYSIEDVDEYIDFLVSKYEELYREYGDLEERLSSAMRTLETMRAREAKIAALDKEMKRAAAKILSDAEGARHRILAEAEERRGQIIEAADAYAARATAEADARAAAQEARVEQIKEEVASLQNTLFAAYSNHIDRIEALTALVAAVPTAAVPVAAEPLEEVAEEIVPIAAAETEEIEPIATTEELAESDMLTEDEYTAEELADADAFDDFEEIEPIATTEETEETDTVDDDALLRSLHAAFGLHPDAPAAEDLDTDDGAGGDDETPDEEAVAMWESFEEFSDFDKFSTPAKKTDDAEEYEEVEPYEEIEEYEEYEEVPPKAARPDIDSFAFLDEDE